MVKGIVIIWPSHNDFIETIKGKYDTKITENRNLTVEGDVNETYKTIRDIDMNEELILNYEKEYSNLIKSWEN